MSNTTKVNFNKLFSIALTAVFAKDADEATVASRVQEFIANLKPKWESKKNIKTKELAILQKKAQKLIDTLGYDEDEVELAEMYLEEAKEKLTTVVSCYVSKLAEQAVTAAMKNSSCDFSTSTLLIPRVEAMETEVLDELGIAVSEREEMEKWKNEIEKLKNPASTNDEVSRYKEAIEQRQAEIHSLTKFIESCDEIDLEIAGENKKSK